MPDLSKKRATGRFGATTDQKMTVAVRQPTFSVSADAVSEYAGTQESTNLEPMMRFWEAVIVGLETEWLRDSSVEELKHYESIGFPGCVGALDCASWE